VHGGSENKKGVTIESFQSSPLCPWYLRDYSEIAAAPSVAAGIRSDGRALQSLRNLQSFCLSGYGYCAFGGMAGMRSPAENAL
jgi:hypothetical protein